MLRRQIWTHVSNDSEHICIQTFVSQLRTQICNIVDAHGLHKMHPWISDGSKHVYVPIIFQQQILPLWSCSHQGQLGSTFLPHQDQKGILGLQTSQVYTAANEPTNMNEDCLGSS